MKQAKLLTNAEFRWLTAIINSLRYPTRNHTIIALSFYAGLRACEIAALRIGDVFDDFGRVKDTIYLNSAQTKGSDSLDSSFKCNTSRPLGIGCCDGHTKQAPQQRGPWRDISRA